jgi:ComF family protein
MALKDTPPAQLSRQALQFLLDVVFPPVCARCRRVGSVLCDACSAGLVRIAEPICLRCGRQLEKHEMTWPISECTSCRRSVSSVNQMRAPLYYSEPTSSLIHQFKYEGYFSLAGRFANLMAGSWPEWDTPPDLVVPIPLHKKRQRRRGYNQSALLARPLAQARGLDYNDGILQRVRHTVPQVGLGPEERILNVHEAFEATGDAQGRNILLIDDVLTTGATMRSAADTLKSRGAASVSAYCLARVS